MRTWAARIAWLVVALAARDALGWSRWVGLLVYVGTTVLVETVLVPVVRSLRRPSPAWRSANPDEDHRRADIVAARRVIEARLIERPNDIAALRELLALLERDSDWHNALNAYNNLIYHSQDQADHAFAFYRKARVLQDELRLPDKAIAHYEKCLAIDPNHAEARERLAGLSGVGRT